MTLQDFFNLLADNPLWILSYFLLIPLTVVLTLAARNLTKTKIGRAFIAIRDNDLAAEVMGVNLLYYKLLAFFIGCFLAA